MVGSIADSASMAGLAAASGIWVHAHGIHDDMAQNGGEDSAISSVIRPRLPSSASTTCGKTLAK